VTATGRAAPGAVRCGDHHYAIGPVKVAEMLKLLAGDGWEIKNTRGSHRQLIHPVKPGKVTVAGKSSVDIPKGTEAAILRQAGLK